MKIDNDDALIVLDGLYGAIQEVIKSLDNQSLRNHLGILEKTFKRILISHAIGEKLFAEGKFSGCILNLKNLKGVI